MGSPLIGVKFGRDGAVWGGAGRKQFNLAVREAEIRYKDGNIHACPTAPFQQFFLPFALHQKSLCLPYLFFFVFPSPSRISLTPTLSAADLLYPIFIPNTPSSSHPTPPPP